MARPKFRRLSYDLYEALERARLPGSTYQIILIIIDHTVGYQLEEAPISLTRFQDKSNLSRQGVIKAIRDAERRKIICVNREGINPKAATVYALNMDFWSWVTGRLPETSKRELTRTSKPELTSKLVNGSLPDWSTGIDQTSQLATFATPTERNSKETPRGNTVTINDGVTTLGEHPSYDDSKNHKERIINYLNNNICRINELSQSLGISHKSLRVYLSLLKKEGLVYNPFRGAWRMCPGVKVTTEENESSTILEG